MILGTTINWKPFLITVKDVDDAIIRKHTDVTGDQLDYATFIKIFNDTFPGADARDILYCSDIFPKGDVPLRDILLLNNAIAIKYNTKGFVFVTGNLNDWLRAISLSKHLSFETKEVFAQYESQLRKIDVGLFK